ncbi:N-acyl-D-amino-acid deacylase [Lachnotalea glycerini]|uniref:N-acyl-D-amino-acid deacylase n=1 Tax=Lachnotalea glycerini TaxID=1763509 RepID=A0A318EL08_9FIRM|nr:amidohydrolase family protein [Lachnotalea glycerini]PXV86873.1 N-acyl-D-amino-acid deacylase [Lachnotalea glycerini]
MDVLIKNGIVVDGSGNQPFIADVAIERDIICGIGHFEKSEARRVIDAAGKMVTPGFIDGHTHAELTLLKNRQCPNEVYQGISTIVTGQCGLGFAPIKNDQFEDSIKINSGIFGDCRHYLKHWNSFQEFLNQLDGAAINAAANVSHNAIRQMALGFENKPLKGEALQIAKEALDQAMKEGALGMSVGLSYYPGGYSDTNELIELCKIVKENDGLFCTHLRLNNNQIPLSPVEEMVQVVKKTGVRLNMLHYRTGGYEDISTLFQPFKELEERGADIHYEYYPYLVGAGLVLALVPDWAQEGGYSIIMERLQSAELRDKLLKDMKERHQYFFAKGQTAMINITKDMYAKEIGKSISEIAEEHGESFSEAVIRLLIENELQVGFIGIENQSEELKSKLYEDQYQLFMDPRYTMGSDTIPEGVICHPRGFGSFPRTICQMRERSVAPEYIIQKLTSVPAQLYHLKDRGLIDVGKKADVCILDFDKVRDTATFLDTRRQPEGIESLLVNGLPVMLNGSLTGILSGRALKKE